MNKWIVITSINHPTSAIQKISRLVSEGGWRCVVVGDKKSPKDWSYEHIEFLSYDDQIEQFGPIALAIPANHYCRKNLGYLHAIRCGAEVILETDDDNIPLETFGRHDDIQVRGDLVSGEPWVNIYSHFTPELIWPRGNPLDSIHNPGRTTGKVCEDALIQQFLADGDPDVDAIYRLLFKSPLNFNQREPVFLEPHSWCSFNSQNTLIHKAAFPLLYLPCFVSFRMTDIWRSFVAQAALWAQDKKMCFRASTVRQERNTHDLNKDFADEVDGYLNNRRIAEELSRLVVSHAGTPFAAFSRMAWERLHDIGIINDSELKLQAQWQDACSREQ